MEEDFIKVDIFEDDKDEPTTEYHMYPLNRPPSTDQGEPPFEKYDAHGSKYSVLMVMLDSVSHGCVQRYLKNTYTYLEENPNTVIMKVIICGQKKNRKNTKLFSKIITFGEFLNELSRKTTKNNEKRVFNREIRV